jgi:hypothetical protein
MFPSPFQPHLFFSSPSISMGCNSSLPPAPIFFSFLAFFSFFLFLLPWIIAPISTLQLFFLQLLAMAMVVQATTIVVVIAFEQ